VDRGDAGPARRIRAPRRVARSPRRRCLVGRVLGDVLLGSLRELGPRAPPRASGRGARRGGGRPPRPTAQRSSCGAGGRPPRGRSARRAAPHAAWPGLERVGDRRRQDGLRETSARERPAPARPAAWRLGRAPPSRPRLRGPRRGGAVRPRNRPRHHRPPCVGCDQRRRGRPGPLPRTPERRSHGRPVRGLVGTAHDAPRGDPGPGQRGAGRARGPRDPARAAARFVSHGPSPPHEATPRRLLRSPMGRRRAQHPPVGVDRRRQRRELRGVPTGRTRARVPGPEPRLRRRRWNDRVSVHRAAPDPQYGRRDRSRPPVGPPSASGRASCRSRSSPTRSIPTADTS